MTRSSKKQLKREFLQRKFPRGILKSAKGYGRNEREACYYTSSGNSGNLTAMISMIQTLMDKGYAYAVADGTVYFRVKKFKEYGKSSHKTWMTCSLDSVHFRYQERTRKKIRWTSYSGNRRKKGNHTGLLRGAMAVRAGTLSALLCLRNILETRSISCGGEDLIFPHHENEIAQSECCNDKIFCKILDAQCILKY